MRRPTLLLAMVLAGLLGLVAAAPTSAAVTGTFCGEVTAFTAPTAVTDGSITLDGTTEVIDSTAFGAITAGTLVALDAVASADATTCVDITANAGGDIVDIEIAAQAEICGAVTFDAAADAYSVDGVLVPASLVAADADLEALLAAAAAGAATVCLDVTVDTTTGAMTTVALRATVDLCGDAILDADSVTLGGVDVPLTLLDAEAEAVLRLAIDAGADVCLGLVVDDTELVQANLRASIDLCGDVTLDAEGDVVVDGTEVGAALLSAGARALLELAAEADGTACAAVEASSVGGDTTVGVTVSIDVCAEVTAVTDDTITLGDVTFVFAGAADADIEIGDVVCVTAITGPTGEPVITDTDTTDGVGPDTGSGSGGPMLPDTAAPAAWTGSAPLGALLVLLAGVVAADRIRRSSADG